MLRGVLREKACSFKRLPLIEIQGWAPLRPERRPRPGPSHAGKTVPPVRGSILLGREYVPSSLRERVRVRGIG